MNNIIINEDYKLKVNPSLYIRKNDKPSNVTVYSSEKDNCSLEELETIDKSLNRLTFSGHFYIRTNGQILRGRPLDSIGEYAYNADNTVNLNYNNIGVCLEGDFNSNFLPDIQKFSLYKLFEYLKGIYGQDIRMLYLRELDFKNNPGILFPYNDISRKFYDLFPVSSGLIGNLYYDAFGSRELKYIPANLMKGTDVFTVQVLLKKLNIYKGPLNGEYNELTKVSVGNYQIERDLVNSGIAGYKTLDRMKDDIKKLYSSKKFTRILYKDDNGGLLEGKDILSIQKELNKKRFNCNENGIYDITTELAVRRFQVANNIDEDGKVGPITWNTIFESNSSSSFRNLILITNNLMYGEDVKLLQQRLCELNYRLPITEKYDYLTESTVRRYQIQKNFPQVDGIVTKEVWDKIFSNDQEPF